MKKLRLLIPLMLLAITASAQTKPASKAKQTATEPQKQPAATQAEPTKLDVAGPISDELFHHFVLPHAAGDAPAGYGTTPAHPILIGAYEADMSDQKKIAAQIECFLKTYLYEDGTVPVFTQRKTVMIDAVNYDLFKVTKPGTTDTLTLYADMYKTGPVYAPKGFKFYAKEQLVGELAPIVQMIRGYNATADKYGDAAAKVLSFKIVNQLSSNVGIDYLLDKSYIGALFNDTGVDLDLKAFLIRSFMGYSFQYQVEGQPNPKAKAFNSMLDDYEAAIKKHPNIFARGVLPSLVRK
ncbi:hypothetical protein [Mucilaginibacter myungsuensis]|uniref:DUF4835 family protein n=1 Tax=Mucilaginibacter myungsuensis TaxID=649104 RepID=A0A929KZG9_9SPHI|nr:hypothetical protein [Mucilaginibacter myungsuensis]MBE9663313.1 hypothetical protein [Mucilaginibacter myungsuensis]MDN3600048.1 hypothetical protein [Mucilaginibacter myungsuensis]